MRGSDGCQAVKVLVWLGRGSGLVRQSSAHFFLSLRLELISSYFSLWHCRLFFFLFLFVSTAKLQIESLSQDSLTHLVGPLPDYTADVSEEYSRWKVRRGFVLSLALLMTVVNCLQLHCDSTACNYPYIVCLERPWECMSRILILSCL